MATNRYANGKIYRLVNSVDNEEYVGSTCGKLSKRKSEHKGLAKIQTTRRVYQHLNEVGWESVEIVLIEEYPCQNKMELERRERYWIEEMKPSLNKNVPTRTAKEFQTKYYIDNADKICEAKAKYYAENQDKMRERRAKYYAENSDKERERIAKWQTENAEKVREHQAKWYDENAEKVRERARERQAKCRAENPEKMREINARYRAKKKAEREASTS